MRPQFWLKVRKEYIFDNLSELTEYLRLCPYTPGDQTANVDFDSTLDCMIELLGDISEQYYSTPIYHQLPANFEREKYIRLFGATLLASHKSQRPCADIILSAIAILHAMRSDFNNVIIDKFWEFALRCACGETVDKFGFGWSDITSSPFAIPVFIHKFTNTTFRHNDESVSKVFEGKGLVIFGNDGLKIAPMNASDYFNSVEHFSPQISLANRFQIILPQSHIDKPSDFSDYFKSIAYILESLTNIRPSAVISKKTYDHGDRLIVRITSSDRLSLIAESIDPDYETIKGRVSYNNTSNNIAGQRPDRDAILSFIKPGQFIEVEFNDQYPDVPFDLTGVLEEYYRAIAVQFANEWHEAIYISQTEKDSLWVTDEGIRVRIHEESLKKLSDEEIEYFYNAISHHIPIKIRFYQYPPDMNKDNFVMYGSPDIDMYAEPSVPFTVVDADKVLLGYFTNEIGESLPESFNRPKYQSIDRRPVEVMMRMLWLSAVFADLNTLDTLKCIGASAMLARILSRDADCNYLQFQRRYQGRLYNFASNRPVDTLIPDPEIASLPDVEEKVQIVECLRTYIDPDNASRKSSNANTLSQVSRLVNASNDILGIVGKLEINNIKHAITKALDIDDEFVPILDNRTFYGIENSALEFKKSVVFVPVNRRLSVGNIIDPETQKWAILKTIMGFLNSLQGGELLLGVNDSGYASGLQQDIDELFKRKYISHPDADHYRTYVQALVDRAFAVESSNISSSDIVRLNVSYDIETNDEQRQILRVAVKPYMRGIVTFREANRPEEYSDAYIRLSGRTVTLTPDMRQEIRRRKSL